MAKRRFNTKFVSLLLGGIVLAALGLVGAIALRDRVFHEHPEKYVMAGKAALANGDYATARTNFEKAARLSRADAQLDVLLGDAINGLASKDVDNVAAARGNWEQALTIDPANMAAQKRMVQFWHDQMDLHNRMGERAQYAGQMEKSAADMLKVDPDDHFARTMEAEATLETQIDGMQTDSVHVQGAQQALIKAEGEDPADADIPYYLSVSYLIEAQDATRSDDLAGQSHFISLAMKVLDDALHDQPDNAYMHYRCGQAMLQIVAGKMSDPDLSLETKALATRAVGEVDRARELVSADDPHYLEINLYDARLALERPSYVPNAPMPRSTGGGDSQVGDQGAPGGLSDAGIGGDTKGDRAAIAERIYRDVLSHRPNDPATTVALAELLGNERGRRDEAIALLSAPLVEDHPVPGIKGTMLPLFQYQANIHLLSLEIDAIESARDSQQRQKLMSTADALCDKVYGKNPDSATVLGLKGRLELAHDRVVDATQTLKHALALTDPEDLTQRRSRYELMYNLARACEVAQQTGDAKKLATDIITMYPQFVPARLMLARLLITEHDYAGAKPQIDFLESLLPTNPELTTQVARMRLVTLDPVKDAERIKTYYTQLPERTKQEQIDKAALGMLVKYDADALRLDKLAHENNPGDSEAAGNLANWYETHGQKEQALAVLKQALALNPNDTNLLAFQIQLQAKDQSPGGQTDQGGPGQAGGGDAFSQEVAQVSVARSRGDMAAVDAHLAAAEKLKPDAPQIWDAMFTRALETSNWDRASVYLEKLSAGNVDHAGGLIYRVHYELERNDVQKANELALQLTRDKPEFSQSWYWLGAAQKASGNYDDAITSFQQALDRQTQNLFAIRGMVDCYYALGNVERAKHYIDEGRRVAPSNEAFKELALTHELNYGDPQNVIGPRLEAVQATPDNEQAWLNLAAAYVAAQRARAKAGDTGGAAAYYQQARSTLEQAIAKFPDEPRVVAYLSKMAVENGDFATGDQVVRDFASRPMQKGRAETAMMLSDFYALAGKPDLAEKSLRDYLAGPIQASDRAAQVVVQLHLSGLLDKLRRYDDALAVLDTNSQDPALVRQRIGLLINAGRPNDALKALNEAGAAGPLNNDLLSLKGVAEFNLGKLADARDCFDQILASDPNNVYALTERAKAFMADEPPNYAAAVLDLGRARDLAPQDMQTRFLLVEADTQRGNPDDAIKEMESAEQVAPVDKQVRLTLLGLYMKANPPRWADADRVMHDVRQIPALADDPDFAHEEAAMDLAQGEYLKADQLIRAAMAKSPNNLAMVHTYFDILLKTNSFDQLLADSAQLLESHQNSPSLWWVYSYRAEAFVRRAGDRAAATAELENALTAAATLHDESASYEVIQTYRDLLGADAAIKVAGERAQQDPHWLLLAANLCRANGDVDGSITWLETAHARLDSLSPKDKDALLRMAALQYQAKSPPDTLKGADMYRELLKLSPNDLDAMNNLACILVEPGPAFAPGEALHWSESAYNQMKSAGLDDPQIKDTYGWTLIANARVEEGLALIQDALSKKDFPEAHYHLAEGLLKRQPPSAEDAATELGKAMEMLVQAERDGKPVDEILKSEVQEELKRARSGLAG